MNEKICPLLAAVPLGEKPDCKGDAAVLAYSPSNGGFGFYFFPQAGRGFKNPASGKFEKPKSQAVQELSFSEVFP